MDNNSISSNLVQDVIGVFSGILGFVMSKLGLTLSFMSFFTSDFFPTLAELVHDLTVAFLCAVAGFIATKMCHFVYVKLIKSFNWFKNLFYENN